nr:hypothetical protein [Staphylococcus aureus]
MDRLEIGRGWGGFGKGKKIRGKGGIMIKIIVRTLIKGKEN